MYHVFAGHALQMVAPLMACEGSAYYPAWLYGFNEWFTWQQMHMHCFMFISGIFSSERLNHEIMVRNFALLLLAPFLWQTYYDWFANYHLNQTLSKDGLEHGLYIGRT
eukprot:4598451-Pyramimonas_sp.AAC.1